MLCVCVCVCVRVCVCVVCVCVHACQVLVTAHRIRCLLSQWEGVVTQHQCLCLFAVSHCERSDRGRNSTFGSTPSLLDRSWTELRTKLTTYVCISHEVASNFVRSVPAKFASKWKHIFRAYCILCMHERTGVNRYVQCSDNYTAHNP